MARLRVRPEIVVDRFYRGAIVFTGEGVLRVPEVAAQLIDALIESGGRRRTVEVAAVDEVVQDLIAAGIVYDDEVDE